MATDSYRRRRGGSFESFRHRDFTAFWCASFVSNIGTWMQLVTVPYVIDQLTHSTAWVGFSAFVTFFPAVLLAPLAGSLADHYSRKRIVLVTQTMMALAALALFLIWTTGIGTRFTMLACIAAGAIAQGLNSPSQSALTPTLVPREHIEDALRVATLSMTAARAFGPGLAGLALVILGPGASFLLNALSFIPVIVVLLTISERFLRSDHARPRLVSHFREGFAYMRGRAAIALPITMMFVYMLLGGSAPQLFEPFVRHVLSGSQTQYGMLAAAYGIGGLAGSVTLVFFGDRVRRSRIVVVGLASYVSVEVLFGAAPTYGVAVAVAAIMGIMQSLIGVSLFTSIHANVDEHHRGRVSGIFQMSYNGGMPIGALSIGIVAGYAGLRAALVGAGALLAVGALVITARAGGLGIIDSRLASTGSPTPRPAPERAS